MSQPLATVGVISIGAMGLGVAKLLLAYNYRVVTCLAGRGPSTLSRAASTPSLVVLSTHESLIQEADFILSIVPPAKAIETAQSIIAAFPNTDRSSSSSSSNENVSAEKPLYYFDLNAISPSRARSIEKLFKEKAPAIKFVDGGIIGGPPTFLKNNDNDISNSTSSTMTPIATTDDPTASLQSWKRPSIPLSGPHTLPTHLTQVLNAKHISPDIGTASGLKCTFASLTKGLTALATQSFTTASSLGVLPHLVEHLEQYSPKTGELAKRGLVGMRSKEGRWVDEMREIGKCFAEEGGWDVDGGSASGNGVDVYERVGGVYEVVAGLMEGKEDVRDLDGVVNNIRDGLKGNKRN